MLTTALVVLTLGSPPLAMRDYADTRDYADRFAYVEVELAPESGEVIAFDVHANAIGLIRTWVDGYGDVWLSSEYDDGYGDIRISGDQIDIFGELPEQELAHRAEVIGSLLDASPTDILSPEVEVRKNSWWKCARWAAAAAVACYNVRPVACVGSSIQAACTCVPKIVKQVEHIECPWNG